MLCILSTIVYQLGIVFFFPCVQDKEDNEGPPPKLQVDEINLPCVRLSEIQKPYQVVPIQSVETREATKSLVSQMKTSNENPSSVTASDAEGAESSQGASVIEVSDWISQNKVSAWPFDIVVRESALTS